MARRPSAWTLLRGLHELVPRPRRPGHAGLGEQVAVVEERAGARRGSGSRRACPGTRRRARRRSRKSSRVFGRQDLVGRVEQAVLGVAREGVQVEHVGRLVVLDHRADLLVDRVPVDDLQIDLDAGLLRVLLGQALPERARVVLAVLRDHHLDGLAAARPAAGADERHGHRAHRQDEHASSVHAPSLLWRAAAAPIHLSRAAREQAFIFILGRAGGTRLAPLRDRRTDVQGARERTT